MKPNKYAYSFTEDDYTGEYDTPEEAAQVAFETDDNARALLARLPAPPPTE